MHPGRKIEAIDLATGLVAWQSEAAEKPLWVAGSTLFAQAFDTVGSAQKTPEEPGGPGGIAGGNQSGALRILSLDTANGDVLPLSHEVPLPLGVVPLIDDQPAQTFNVKMRPVSQDLAVLWEYRDTRSVTRPWPGSAPPRIVHEVGSVQLQASTPGVVEIDAIADLRLVDAPTALSLLLGSDSLQPPFWLVDDLIASITAIPLPGSNRELLLNRWNATSADALPSLALFEGRVVAFRGAANEREVLVVTATGEAPGGVPRYLWTLFSLASGKRQAELEMNRSALPFSLVAEGLLVVTPPYGYRPESQDVAADWIEEPTSIRLLDSGTGEEIWSRAIRDTVNRGPVPPSPVRNN
jgi:hypothetical protein